MHIWQYNQGTLSYQCGVHENERIGLEDLLQYRTEHDQRCASVGLSLDEIIEQSPGSVGTRNKEADQREADMQARQREVAMRPAVPQQPEQSPIVTPRQHDEEQQREARERETRERDAQQRQTPEQTPGQAEGWRERHERMQREGGKE